MDGFEEVFNRLAATGSSVEEDLQVAMFVSSLKDKQSSRFGAVIASLQTRRDKLDWESVTATLIQEYDDHSSSAGGKDGLKLAEASDPEQALAAGGRRTRNYKGSYENRSSDENRRCFRCNKKGHIARRCPMKYEHGHRNEESKATYN